MTEQKKMESKFIIPATVVKAMLECVSKDPTRQHIAGLCIDTENKTVFATDGHRMAVREIDDTLTPPPWEQVVPSNYNFRVEMELDKNVGLLATVKKRFKTDNFGKVTFEPDPKEIGKYFLVFSTVDGDVSARIPTQSITFKSDVELDTWAIGVNPKYLIGALERLLADCAKSSVPSVQLDLGGCLDPFVLRTPQGKSNDVEVVMPQRV